MTRRFLLALLAAVPGVVSANPPTTPAPGTHDLPVVPMPVTPTLGPIGVDCDGRAVGCPCPAKSRPSLLNSSWGPLRFLTGSPAACEKPCGPSCDQGRKPLIHIELNIGRRSDSCGTSKPCLERFKEWVCYKPDTCRTIPIWRPTPYHAPVAAYFPCEDSKVPTGGGCANGGCANGPRVRERLSGAIGSLRPGWFGECGGPFGRKCGQPGCDTCGGPYWDADCPGSCKPATLRYACPLGVPTAKANPDTGGFLPPVTNAAAPVTVTPAVYQQKADDRPLVARPFTKQ